MSEGYDNNQEVNVFDWESIDEKKIINELLGFCTRCNEAARQLKAMFANNECKKTEDVLKAFAYGDLGTSGWISEFHQTNSDSFSKYLNGNARPTWYSELPLDKQKKYDMIMTYYKDTFYLLSAFSDLYKILVDLVDRQTLREGFRVGYMIFNFEDAGISDSTYRTIEIDARQVSDRINRSWGDTENIAQSSKRFLEDNSSRMDFSSLKAGYRKARLKDYIDSFRNSVLADSFGVQSDGTFYVKAGILAKVRVIDRYTFVLAQTEYIGDVMEKLIETCKEITNKQLLPYEKNARTEAGGNCFMMLRRLTAAITEYAETVLGAFKAYKDADPNSSPFCFMGKPSLYSSVQKRYSFQPSWQDPWDGGTDYADLYVMEAVSLTEHCEEFVRKHGNTDFRD